MKDIINKAFGKEICLNACFMAAWYRTYFKPPVNSYIDTDRTVVIPWRENLVNKQKQL